MRLLVADDEPVTRTLIVSTLRKAGYDVVAAQDGAEAWEILQREDVRLVVADWMMPRVDGLELIGRLRSSASHRYVYFILLTSRDDKADIVQGLGSGADDYITKPFHREELFARIRTGVRVVQLEQDLERTNAQLREMALFDGLTGIPNRRSFDTELQRIVEHSRRFNHPFSVVMLDIDHFKAYNDAFGHDSGDRALRRVAQVLASSIRSVDTAFRYGGEEFVALLPETAIDGGLVVAERLRLAVQSAAITHPANPPHGVVTVSVGVSTCLGGSHRPVEEVLRDADQALYRAKQAGRNRVAFTADQPVGA